MGSHRLLQPLDSVLPTMTFYSPDLRYTPSTPLDDEFEWLPEMHPMLLEEYKSYVPFYEDTLHATKIDELEKAISTSCERDKLQLPNTFRMFFLNTKLPSRIPSTSANYFGIYPDEVIVCRPEFAGGNGGILIRFWTDQQGCYYWYLYLDSHGRHCVVGTEQDLQTDMAEEGEKDNGEDDEDEGDNQDNEQEVGNEIYPDASQTGEPQNARLLLPEDAEEEIHIWASSFKQFIFLVWGSNTCDHKKTHLKIPLTKQEQEYFNSYGFEWGNE